MGVGSRRLAKYNMGVGMLEEIPEEVEDYGKV